MQTKDQQQAERFDKKDLYRAVQVLLTRAQKYESEALVQSIENLRGIIDTVSVAGHDLKWQKTTADEVTLDTPINQFQRSSIWKSFLRRLKQYGAKPHSKKDILEVKDWPKEYIDFRSKEAREEDRFLYERTANYGINMFRRTQVVRYREDQRFLNEVEGAHVIQELYDRRSKCLTVGELRAIYLVVQKLPMPPVPSGNWEADMYRYFRCDQVDEFLVKEIESFLAWVLPQIKEK
jgi:hypothetical protein